MSFNCFETQKPKTSSSCFKHHFYISLFSYLRKVFFPKNIFLNVHDLNVHDSSPLDVIDCFWLHRDVNSHIENVQCPSPLHPHIPKNRRLFQYYHISYCLLIFSFHYETFSREYLKRAKFCVEGRLVFCNIIVKNINVPLLIWPKSL